MGEDDSGMGVCMSASDLNEVTRAGAGKELLPGCTSLCLLRKGPGESPPEKTLCKICLLFRLNPAGLKEGDNV